MDKKQRIHDVISSLLDYKNNLLTARNQLDVMYGRMKDYIIKISSLDDVIDYLTDESVEIIEKEANERIKTVTEICEFLEKYYEKDKEEDYI